MTIIVAFYVMNEFVHVYMCNVINVFVHVYV